MFERYTERARRVLFFARYEASQLGSLGIESEHLLLGLLREDGGTGSGILRGARLGLDRARAEIGQASAGQPKLATSVEMPLGGWCKGALKIGSEDAVFHAHR